MPTISIINYGVGNLRSVKNGIEKSGARVLITRNPEDLIESDAIVLPGVGAFAEAVKNLNPLFSVVTKLVESGKPFLGICLGLQLLFSKSDEGDSIEGLNLISGNIIKLPDSVKIPQMGWNTLEIVKPHTLFDGVQNNSYAYFVHAYIPQPIDPSVIITTTEYGVKFPSTIIQENLFATQFHPEKSGKTGLRLLRNFVRIIKR